MSPLEIAAAAYTLAGIVAGVGFLRRTRTTRLACERARDARVEAFRRARLMAWDAASERGRETLRRKG